jgi:uncharacterized protein
VRYNLEWDPIKARENVRKHYLSFERAAEVLLDPLAISIVDEEHSEGEERWVTLGRDRQGTVLILIHTFAEISADECGVRIISARKAARHEVRQYEEGRP